MVRLVKAMVFPVVMYGCESWTVKKAERWRIDAFELWCWRRLLRVPWTARRSNPSILKEISPGCSLEGLMLKLKLQCFGHLMQRVDSLEKTLMLGGSGGRRKGGQQRMRWCWMASPTRWTWVWVNSRSLLVMSSDGQGGLACCNSWGRKGSDTTEWLNWMNWTESFLLWTSDAENQKPLSNDFCSHFTSEKVSALNLFLLMLSGYLLYPLITYC